MSSLFLIWCCLLLLLIDTAQTVCLKVYQQLLSLAVEVRSRQMAQISCGQLEAKSQEEGQLKNDKTLRMSYICLLCFPT